MYIADYNLVSANLPSSLVVIADGAFQDCYALKTITISTYERETSSTPIHVTLPYLLYHIYFPFFLRPTSHAFWVAWNIHEWSSTEITNTSELSFQLFFILLISTSRLILFVCFDVYIWMYWIYAVMNSPLHRRLFTQSGYFVRWWLKYLSVSLRTTTFIGQSAFSGKGLLLYVWHIIL